MVKHMILVSLGREFFSDRYSTFLYNLNPKCTQNQVQQLLHFGQKSGTKVKGPGSRVVRGRCGAGRLG